MIPTRALAGGLVKPEPARAAPPDLRGSLARFEPIGLAGLDASAELHQRVDRKYLVDGSDVVEVLGALPGGHLALEIDGSRSFRYETVYFDTGDLASYHAAARNRPHRAKVRMRTYTDVPRSVVEVKVRDRSAVTVKSRFALDRAMPADFDAVLDDAALAFVRQATRGAGLDAGLAPSMLTRFRRSTIVDPEAGTRFTIDAEVRGQSPDGLIARLDAVVLETKSDGRAALIDRLLWRRGIRPTRVSKYCTTLAAVRPDLPSNRWHRTVAHHLVVE